MTEIFRAGLQSIHHGQREAAEAMGMSQSQTLRRVILPQAVRIIIPDIGNQFIAMQKDSFTGILHGFMGNYLSSESIGSGRQQIYGNVYSSSADVLDPDDCFFLARGAPGEKPGEGI